MLTYSNLREIQKKEVEGGALVELGDDFYQEVSALLQSKKEEARSGDMIAVKEYENTRRLLSMIQTKREEKIFLMALRSERSTLGLTKEERDTFLKIQQILSEHRTLLFSESLNNTLVRKIRILSDVEQYKGSDKKIYGPFQKGKEYLLPRSESEWLLKEKMAEIVI